MTKLPPSKFPAASKQRNPDADRHYDKYARDPKASAFYHSAEWLGVRKMVLARDHGLCQECLRHGKVTAARQVHHRLSLLDHWERRLDPANLESICDECHNRERADGSTTGDLSFDEEGNLVRV